MYIAPDGRRFRADMDKRQYGSPHSWTLFSVAIAADGDLARDNLEKMLFVDHGKIIRLDFGTTVRVVDTGWKPADLTEDSD